MSNEVAMSGDKRMTVKEVATILGCSERTVQEHIKDICPEIVRNGCTTFLSEPQVTAIKLRIEKSGRNDLANLRELPKTMLEKQLLIQQALQFQAEIITDLQFQIVIKDEKIAIDAPKVEFYDTVASSDGMHSMEEVAKMLAFKNMGRNNLFKYLRERQVLQRDNRPYQVLVNQGYFKLIEKWYERGDVVDLTTTTMVTVQGLDYIRRLLIKDGYTQE